MLPEYWYKIGEKGVQSVEAFGRNIGERLKFTLAPTVYEMLQKAKRERYIEMLIGPHSRKAKLHLKENIQVFKATTQSDPLWLLGSLN